MLLPGKIEETDFNREECVEVNYSNNTIIGSQRKIQLLSMTHQAHGHIASRLISQRSHWFSVKICSQPRS